MCGNPFHKLTALEKADRYLVFQASLVTSRRLPLSELEANAVKLFAAYCDDHDYRSRSQAAAALNLRLCESADDA